MNSEKRRTVFFRAFWRIVILLFVMIPLLWGVRTSLCASNYDKNLIPKEFTLDNYSNLLKSPSFLPGIWNSVMVSLCTILILLPIVTLASYALGRMKFKGRFLEKVLLLLPLLPAIAILIPLVQNMNAIGLYNNLLGVIVLNVVFLLPFTTYLLKNFMALLSKSIEEAAFVDGCTRLHTMVYIILPNALPGFASVMVYTFINSWLNYLYPYALIADMNSRTMPQTLLALIGQYGNNYPSLTAASILTLLPPLIFFCIFQKWFIAGLFGTSMK